MFIVNHRKIFYIISGVLMLGSLLAMFIWGFNPGIDFKGGSILEINYPMGSNPSTGLGQAGSFGRAQDKSPQATRPEVATLNSALLPLKLDQSIRPTGERGYIIRLRDITESERAAMMKVLSQGEAGAPEVKRFDSIGPLLGAEALSKSILSIILVLLAIVIFITIAFRKVSEPVASWKYGLITVFALFHDVLVPTGVFVALGH